MNKVMLMGRLTRDPEIRYSNGQNGQMAIARFTLAVDRRVSRKNADSNQQTADFISCTAFGFQAEFAEKYLKKGSQIIACGRIQTGSYDKNGTRVYTTDVIVEEFEFAGSRQSSGDENGFGGQNFGGQNYGNQNFGGNNYGGNNSYGAQNGSRPSPASAIGDDFMNIPESAEDDSLPFH